MGFDTLKEKINAYCRPERATITVMGLGYVGLPLAVSLAQRGYSVLGYDPDAAKIKSLRNGKASERFIPSDDPSILRRADVVLICVPTPLSKIREPDLSYVRDAVDLISRYQHKDMLIVLGSTTYPGTTREIVVPSLTKKGFELGESVFIAYSPERMDPGNINYNPWKTPRVVAGATPKCLELAQNLYSTIVETIIPVASLEVAEMVKVFENTFRAVNIGLANELALICRKFGVDPFEVIDAASSKPFGFMPFYPGPGLGGHCIPVDPLYLSWKLRSLQSQSRFIELAETINSGMPDHVVSVAMEALNDHGKAVKGSKVLVLGVTYKPDVADTRQSPGLTILDKLRKLGAHVAYQDPLVPSIGRYKCEGDLSYADFDAVVITSPHKTFDLNEILDKSNLIIDTRGVLRDLQNKPLKNPKIYRI